MTMTSVFYSSLSKDFSLILNDVNDSNVIIQVGENQEFYAHSIILRARSPYFRKAFSTELIIKENNMFIFNKSNIPPSVFKLILKFIYTGELDLAIQLSEDVLGLLVASDELLLGELFEHVQDYLMEQQSTWIQQNFVYVLHTVFNLTSCKKLRDYCLEFISEDPQPLIASKDFPSLDKEILYNLFERNDLQIDEVVAWDCLIKWGIGQTGLECKKSIGWNSEDYETLEKTLCQLIPLIRFVEFTPSEFFNKVSPYKLIIPKEIYEGFKQFHCKGSLPTTIALPPRTRKIKSKIIKPQLTNIIVNWINNKVYRTKCNSRYKFNLIYRGSRDGINNHSFKEKCKGQVASLVLIKTHQSDEIIGGYSSIGFNPIDNKSCDGMLFYYSSDNFIFSFEHSEDTENMKISRVLNHYKAMLVHEDNGFNFGQGSLCMDDQNLYVYNDGDYYENNLHTKSVYTIEEIETFIVVKQ